MIRQIQASKEMGEKVKQTSKGRIDIYSLFPIDRADCSCQSMVMEFKKKLALSNEEDRARMIKETPILVCPRDKTAMTRYEIICQNCGEINGYCWATDSSLEDWCDFHYSQWTDGKEWKGCYTPHISPVTQQLCFECCCGQDTRDFSPNVTLDQKIVDRVENINSIGRKFNQENSKFSAIEAVDVII
jgi:hypothetical protein